jgi:2-oxo-4-hydroxy-4-carboxy--5-ureidoimidazoline (OHCU) decarboxylase
MTASPPEQVSYLLNGHPDLIGPGPRPQTLTASSAAEQMSAGLGSSTMAEATRLVEWNALYRFTPWSYSTYRGS